MKRLGHNDFGRIDARNLGLEGSLGGAGDEEGAGRDIDAGEPKGGVRRGPAPAIASRLLARTGSSRSSSVIVPGVTRRTTSRRTTDLAPRLRASAGSSICSQIGDAVALADQPVQIIVGALDRHAAHGDVLPLMLAALRQDDAERAGGDLGVVEEQFVEIAHPVEQEGARIFGLDRGILRHHRRDFAQGLHFGRQIMPADFRGLYR